MKLYRILILSTSMLIINNAISQSNFTIDFNIGIKQPIVEGENITERDTCYSVSRSSAARYNKILIYGKVSVKYSLSEKLKIGLNSELCYILNERFSYFTNPIFRNVINIPIRFETAYEFLTSNKLDLSVDAAIGYAFQETIIAETYVEERGGLNFTANTKLHLKGKLKGLFVNAGYEYQQDEVLWDIHRIFQIGSPDCPTYTFKHNRHYINFGIGLSI